jgi:hypothetical protein
MGAVSFPYRKGTIHHTDTARTPYLTYGAPPSGRACECRGVLLVGVAWGLGSYGELHVYTHAHVRLVRWFGAAQTRSSAQAQQYRKQAEHNEERNEADGSLFTRLTPALAPCLPCPSP